MKKLLFALIINFVFLFSFTSNVSAKVITMERGFAEIPRDEIVDDDLFIFGETVQIDGTINGDVYAGGETVRVTGTINGDLHVGAGMFNLSGKVSEDVYAGAGNVAISKADIGDSVVVGTGNINIDKDSKIGGSLLVGTGTLATYAPVTRNLFVGAGNVDIDTEIGGETRIAAGNISIGPNTKIGKDLYYTVGEEGKDANISQSASISGMVRKVQSNFNERDYERAKNGMAKGFQTFNIFAMITSFLGALLIGYLLFRFFDKPFSGSTKILRNDFWKSLGVGFLATVFILPVLLLLAVSIIGLPLAGILLLLFLLKLYLSKLVVGNVLGEIITEKMNWKKMSLLKIFAIGLFALYVLKALPVIGAIVSLVTLWSGLGAMILYFKGEHLHKTK